MGEDYYRILKVPRDADGKAIRKAYLKLSLQNHPDKNEDPQSAENFKQIARAYQVLSDDDTKAYYDKHGVVPGEYHEKSAFDLFQTMFGTNDITVAFDEAMNDPDLRAALQIGAGMAAIGTGIAAMAGGLSGPRRDRSSGLEKGLGVMSILGGAAMAVDGLVSWVKASQTEKSNREQNQKY